MSITRTTLTDDSGSGTDGTILNNAWLQVVYDALDARWSRITTTSTGTQNNLSITSTQEADLLICNNASDLTITGIVAPASPAKPGKRLVIVSTGAGNVFLAHQNASSTAANRLINFATSGNTPLAAGSGGATYVYDDANSRWRLTAHDQGAFITPTFAAGNFTASGSQTWTVDSGDVLTYAYRLGGRKMLLEFWVVTSTVGGTPAAELRIAVPASMTATKGVMAFCRSTDNSTNRTGICFTTASSGILSIYSDVSGTNWVAATNTTAVAGEIAFEVN